MMISTATHRTENTERSAARIALAVSSRLFVMAATYMLILLLLVQQASNITG